MDESGAESSRTQRITASPTGAQAAADDEQSEYGTKPESSVRHRTRKSGCIGLLVAAILIYAFCIHMAARCAYRTALRIACASAGPNLLVIRRFSIPSPRRF